MEFALALGLLSIPILNVVDLSFYAFNWMQTQNAAQMGAQAAFSNCNTTSSLPAALNCYGANSANNMTLYDVVYQGIEESALGNTVTLTSGSVTDAYYCSTSSSVLTQVGSAGVSYADSGVVAPGTPGTAPNTADVAPSDSSSTCGNTYADQYATPGEYVRVDVTHTYHPIFSFVSVASLLPATQTATAYVRIN
jgi:hypothetical protein